MRGVIAGSDPNDPTAVMDPLAGVTRGLHGLRIGVDVCLLLLQPTMDLT